MRSSVFSVFIATPNRTTHSSARRNAANTCCQPRVGPAGRRSWSGQGSGPPAQRHVARAAGFAYALGSLAAATGREEFATAAAECIAFENSSYDAERNNWPYLRGGEEPMWPCQWCHGAPGIGLARIAMANAEALDSKVLATDIHNALRGVERGEWKAWIHSAAGRSAVSNSSARPAAPLGAATSATLHRGG